jgi:alkylation response protein AidB-like acyl-CoA dehydrogenase
MVAQRPDSIVAAGFAPSGTARLDGDDLIVNGRWSFSSGSPHADWFMNGVLVMEGDGLRMLPSGRPDWRFVFMPRDEVEIEDTWHVAGLEGTGSHDVVARSVRVAGGRTAMPYFEPAVFDGPLYRLPFTSLLSVFMSPWPLGVARRALDEFAAVAHKKSRSLMPGPVLAEDAAIEVEVARAEAMVRSARAFFLESLTAMWDSVCAGDEVSMPQRTAVYLAAVNTAQASRAAVESVFGMAGASAVFDSSPLQRCARDVMVGTQHIIWAIGRWKTAGRALLGLDPADVTFPAPLLRS